VIREVFHFGLKSEGFTSLIFVTEHRMCTRGTFLWPLKLLLNHFAIHHTSDICKITLQFLERLDVVSVLISHSSFS